MNIISTLLTFLRDVQLEARKVNWPTRERTIRDTIIVILFSAAVAAFLATFDYVFSNALRQFIFSF